MIYPNIYFIDYAYLRLGVNGVRRLRLESEHMDGNRTAYAYMHTQGGFK
jgi:hypothetical protein